MILLDENIPESQRQLLLRQRIRARQIGVDVARKGIADDAILPLLIELSRPTFFTRDLGSSTARTAIGATASPVRPSPAMNPPRSCGGFSATPTSTRRPSAWVPSFDSRELASGAGSSAPKPKPYSVGSSSRPAEFFRRTFLSESLRSLLVGAVQRVAGQGGEEHPGGGSPHAQADDVEVGGIRGREACAFADLYRAQEGLEVDAGRG